MCVCVRTSTCVHTRQAFTATKPQWSADDWVDWCSEQRCFGDRVQKASLPLHTARQQDIAVVKAFVAKRPAAAFKRPAGVASMQPARSRLSRKRTAFSLKRDGQLITAGVKRSIFKGRTA